MNYWAFRIDTRHTDYLGAELDQGRLRQGWGWLDGQDLRNRTVDQGAKDNERMYREVKQGDLLLIPHLPSWGDITIAVATQHWYAGYVYESKEASRTGDHRHIFPAKYVTHFVRGASAVTADLQRSFRSSGRFWSLAPYAQAIDTLRDASHEDRLVHTSHTERTEAAISTAIAAAFDREAFAKTLKAQLNDAHGAATWENVLVDVLQARHPNYTVTRTGGPSEKHHGTDILIEIPSPLDGDTRYGIAVQVKDYKDAAWHPQEVVNQIVKAKSYWPQKGLVLLESWIMLIRGSKQDNTTLAALADKAGIKVFYEEDVQALLAEVALTQLGLPDL